LLCSEQTYFNLITALDAAGSQQLTETAGAITGSVVTSLRVSL